VMRDTGMGPDRQCGEDESQSDSAHLLRSANTAKHRLQARAIKTPNSTAKSHQQQLLCNLCRHAEVIAVEIRQYHDAGHAPEDGAPHEDKK